MSYLMALVVFVSAVWALFDSHKKGARNPAGWAMFVSLFWILTFPYYLYKRRKIVPVDQDQAPSASNRWVGLVISAALCFGPAVYAEVKSALPHCDDPEVVRVLGKMLNGMEISYPAQRPESAEWGSLRLCNATVAGHIQSYNVRWYSDAKDQFIVHLE